MHKQVADLMLKTQATVATVSHSVLFSISDVLASSWFLFQQDKAEIKRAAPPNNTKPPLQKNARLYECIQS